MLDVICTVTMGGVSASQSVVVESDLISTRFVTIHFGDKKTGARVDGWGLIIAIQNAMKQTGGLL